jgi:TolB-like protein/Tfp pilus assembly protein PilF
MGFIAELKRRNVIRMAGLYLVSGWLVVQVAQTLLPAFDVPASVVRGIILVLALGFVPALLFAWIFELTPDGIKLDAKVPPEQSIGAQTARRMEHVTVVVLALALAYFAVDKFVLAPKRMAAENVARAQATVAPPPAREKAESRAPVSSKSIAVLPFENLSEDKANAFFADGIQDQILTGLAKIGDLKVISRTSTLSYASKPENLGEIAKKLGVANILEGSVQKAGNRVRINVQLIAAGTDTHLWAETYDRNLDDIFAVQSEVAQKIAEAMAATISRNELAALQRQPTQVPAAYRAYLKARAIGVGMSSSKAELLPRLAGYREAVRLDPDFALAWAELSWEGNRAVWVGIDDTGALQAEANAALEKARALAPDLPQVALAQAVQTYYEKRDYAGALAQFEALQRRTPSDQDVLMFTGFLARRLGKFDESIDALERARLVAPNDAALAYHLGICLSLVGKDERAKAALEDSLALKRDPSTVFMLLQLAWRRGDLAQADAVLARYDDGSAPMLGLRANQLLYRRDFAGATALFDRAIANASDLQSDSDFNGYIEARIAWGLKQALAEDRLGHADKAKSLFDDAAQQARKALATHPSNPNVRAAWHIVLAIALAGTGDAQAAHEQAVQATQEVPTSMDKLEGPAWVDYALMVDGMNGDAARAVAGLRAQMHTPGSFLSPAILAMDPTWDPIRKDPGFQALSK